MAELRTLQAERKAEEKEQLTKAMRTYNIARQYKKSFDFDSFGFEFSKERFIKFLADHNPLAEYAQYKELKAEPADTMQATA